MNPSREEILPLRWPRRLVVNGSTPVIVNLDVPGSIPGGKGHIETSRITSRSPPLWTLYCTGSTQG